MIYVLYLRALIYLPLLYLYGFFSKNERNIWLFSCWCGKSISDNPKYFYNDLAEINSNIEKYWIVKDRGLEASNKIYYLDLKGLYFQFFSKVLVCSHSVYSDFFPLYVIFNKALRVQLWHGSALKKIMWDVESSYFKKIKRIIFDRYDLIISANDIFKNIFQIAFRCENVVTTGYPRVRFSKQKNEIDNSPSLSSVKKYLYAPTFRDDESNFTIFDDYGFDFEKIDNILSHKGIEFHVRLHPRDVLTSENRKSIQMCSNIYLNSDPDIYETLEQYDVLLTDYSSIFFDFFSYRKPIIFCPFDLDTYETKLRGIYFNYSDISIEPFITDWVMFEVLLESNLKNYDYHRLEILSKKYGQDAKLESSQLIYNEIWKKIQ